MDSAASFKCLCFLLALLYLSTSFSLPEEKPEGVFSSALSCFSDHFIYASCQKPHRLDGEGKLNVPPEATDEYCSGPCLFETKLVLDCIDKVLYGFKFYNGASVADVRYTLVTGCGHTAKRGDFNVAHVDGKPEIYGENPKVYGEFTGNGNRLTVSVYWMTVLGFVLLFWGY